MAHRILLKTTIPPFDDDWCSARFSLLRAHLAGLTAPDGSPLYDVVSRDRHQDRDGNDPDLLTLPTSDTAELWLFAVEVDGGLSDADCAAIRAFRARGGGCMVTRDHQDMGASVLGLGDLGAAHFFQRRNREQFRAQRLARIVEAHKRVEFSAGLTERRWITRIEDGYDLARLVTDRAISAGEPSGTWRPATRSARDTPRATARFPSLATSGCSRPTTTC